MTTTTAAAVGARARGPLRPGTRRGKPATAQAGAIPARPRRLTGGRDVRLVEFTSHGDTAREHPTRLGGSGVFVTAPREAPPTGGSDVPVPPAPGQGAPAPERRTGAADEAAPADLTDALAGIDDPLTRAVVTAERALLAALEAGRGAPVGAPTAPAFADGVGEPVTELPPRDLVGRTDGASLVQMSITGPTATSRDDDETPLPTGRDLSAETFAKGAAGLMGERVH